MADNVWRMLVSEFIGTGILVFVGCSSLAYSTAQGQSVVGSALAFGLALMTLFYTFGSFSGAHFNPAVSFGFAVAGRMNWWLMIGYWIAQLLGGIAAAALVAYFFGTASGVGASIGSLTNTDAWKAVLLEAILTFFLVITVLLVTRNPMLAIIAGVAIGLVLTFDMLAGAPLTGGSMNPARSLGPAIFSNNMGTYWIYVVGPLLGALVAALVYKLLTIDWSCCNKVDECGNPVLDECGNPIKECSRQVLDNCGNPVKDCNGNVYETYSKHERKLTHMQETPLLYLGEWMSSHGFDPRYLKQEIEHSVNKVAPNGVIPNPKEIVKGVLNPGDATSNPSVPLLAPDQIKGPTMIQAQSLKGPNSVGNQALNGLAQSFKGSNLPGNQALNGLTQSVIQPQSLNGPTIIQGQPLMGPSFQGNQQGANSVAQSILNNIPDLPTPQF